MDAQSDGSPLFLAREARSRRIPLVFHVSRKERKEKRRKEMPWFSKRKPAKGAAAPASFRCVDLVSNAASPQVALFEEHLC